MAITKKIIGRIPICFGTWYAKQGGWGIKNRVTLYGSEFESLHENNTVPPAVYDDVENTVTFNENDWRIISNGTEAWLADAKIDALGTWEENPEFVEVTISENGFILYGVQRDGNVIFGNSIPKDIQDALNKIIKNIDDNFGDIKGTFHYVSNPEYLFACIDAEDKFLYGVTAEGKFRAADLDFEIPEEEAKWINTVFSIIKDPEHLEVTIDSEDKMVSWRDNEGTKHETNLKVENKLELSNKAMSDFQQALKDSGFNPGGSGDYSDASEIQIPEPKLAHINITSDEGTATWPNTKTSDCNYWMEFYDGNGNYFKKRIVLNAQGNSALKFEKKNGTIDICNDEWIGDDTCNIRFGNWTPCDSYHLKACYFDFFKGASFIAYKFIDAVDRTRPFNENKPWKKALLSSDDKDDTKVGNPNYRQIVDDVNLQIDNGARCVSDGFPSIVYMNGEFYGIYVVGYKKHRSNYNMNKKNPNHIHLDGGELTRRTLFGGTVLWENFEIRNPKNLVYAVAHIDAKGNSTFKYDADLAQDEIAGTDLNYDGNWVAGSYAIGRVVKLGSNYFINQISNNTAEPITKDSSGNKNTADSPDFKNKTGCGWINCTNSVIVKEHIKNLALRMGQIESKGTVEEQRTELEKYFDIDNIIDYELIQCALHNIDSQGYNWQPITYDGIKWYFCCWDCDRILGQTNFFNYLESAIDEGYLIIGHGAGTPNSWVNTNCVSELKQRWDDLVEKKIIDSDYIISLFKDWIDRIGSVYFEKEYKKWPNSPCNRDSKVNVNWQFETAIVDWVNAWNPQKNYIAGNVAIEGGIVYKALSNNVNSRPSQNPSIWENVTYNPNTTYNVEDEVWYGVNDMFKFKCINSTSDCPVDGLYPSYPQILGYRDNMWRLKTYLDNTINSMNVFFQNINN